MIAELGHYALVLALGAGADPVGRAGDRRARSRRRADAACVARPRSMQFVFVALSFAALAVCYVTSDFSVATVFENSHSQMPLIYKITSVWGNHEGSMLLWVLILALFGAVVAAFGSNLPATLEGPRAGGAVVDRGRLLSLHPAHLESVPAARATRRSRAATSIRSCRTPASPSIRRCSISAMSASRSPSPSPSPR